MVTYAFAVTSYCADFSMGSLGSAQSAGGSFEAISMVMQTRNANPPKAHHAAREARDLPSLPIEADSSRDLALLHLSRRKKGTKPQGPQQQSTREEEAEPQSERFKSYGFDYEARCMCGWVKWYKNPYQASLGSKFHAELWCPCLTNAKGVGAFDCYFCGAHFNDFGRLAVHVQTAHFGRRRENMNVGSYVQGTGEQLPLLDAKLFRKLQDKTKHVVGKILAVREQTKPSKKGWTGLILDLKNGTAKFSFLCGFDRFDIGAIVRQLKSEETDDWIGESIKFVSKKGSEGGTFVNVENPKRKG